MLSAIATIVAIFLLVLLPVIVPAVFSVFGAIAERS